MYDFQSFSSDWSFAMMVSFFRRSFNRPSAFDSGRTHLMISTKSLSVIVAGKLSCLSSAFLAFTNTFACFSNFDFDTCSAFYASKSSCSFGPSEVDNMRVCNKYYLILLFDTNIFFHIYERRPCKSNGEQNDLSYVRSTRTKILT